ncbi:hypothetical protein CV102_21375 [Natronococcus pandeyae]|uniref:Uncharacterized protein n=1 Tax=Natronococcus pandeyae TaxID=2055836 RepID=A0A8J8PY50_9EURY|nr:hypothetical protein [Natronococcus pandeyae]TYL36605.1 hypothetical protein CV102_21375 [Natronococcus pandeyae]
MSKRPTGTTMDDDRLHELRETDETTASALAIDVSALADRMRATPGDPIDWTVDDEREELPMLVVSAIDEEATGEAPYARQLREEDEAVVAPVPDTLLEADPPDGFGLDLSTYDENRALLFDVITIDETIGFVPVRFSDGEPFAADPLPDVAEDSDPVAEETIAREGGGDPTPRPETVSAPIDADLLESALADIDADAEELASDVAGILEGIERHDVVGPDDIVSAHPPLAVESRVLCLLEEGFWTSEIAPRLEAVGVDVGEAALEVARQGHERQAEQLIEAADEPEYRDAAPEYDVAVTGERDTAEWEVSETGTSR